AAAAAQQPFARGQVKVGLGLGAAMALYALVHQNFSHLLGEEFLALGEFFGMIRWKCWLFRGGGCKCKLPAYTYRRCAERKPQGRSQETRATSIRTAQPNVHATHLDDCGMSTAGRRYFLRRRSFTRAGDQIRA